MPASALAEAFEQGLRASQQAFSAGEFEKAFVALAPDIEWHIGWGIFEGDVLRGREAVIRHFEGIHEVGSWQVEAQHVADLGGGRFLVHQRGSYVGRTTQLPAGVDFFQVYEIDEELQVTRVWEYATREE